MLSSSPPPSSSPRGRVLPHAIVEELKELIYSGGVKPGERLNEAALAMRMGISRGPIREAIKVLAGLGLVTAVANRGVFVRQLSVRELLEIYELRALVFGYAADRACDNMTEDHAREFERLLTAMDKACDGEDSALYYGLNLQFHALLLTVSNNQRAHQTYDEYVSELHLVRRKYFDAPGGMRRSNTEHRLIYGAIAAGDKSKARAAAEFHIGAGRERLLANFQEKL